MSDETPAAPDSAPATPAEAPKKRGCGQWLLRLLVLFGIVAALLIGAGWLSSEPRPEGQAGEEAERRIDLLLTATHGQAWEETGAVAWTFFGKHDHLWDRKRQFAEVVDGDERIQIDLASRRGWAERAGVRLEGAELEAALGRAYAYWANDSFWLNPLAKARDEGTSRAAVGERGVLVSYSSGGVTPGDAYLWIIGEDGRPARWQMWVSILPIGGLTATWEGWIELDTGAQVSTRHALLGGLVTLELTNVKGAAELAALRPGADPFAPLEAALRGEAPASRPSAAKDD